MTDIASSKAKRTAAEIALERAAGSGYSVCCCRGSVSRGFMTILLGQW